MKSPRALEFAAVAASLLMAGFFHAGSAGANEPRQHDGGFFLRLSAGGGSAQTKWDQETGFGLSEFELSGAAGDVNLAIGAVVSPNLAVHGTLFGWSTSDPSLKVGGAKFETSDVTLSMSAIGAGVTYYLDPSNVYLSGSIGAATMTLEVDNESQEADTGVAVDVTVGKEWWVGGKWGLGLAGDANYHSIPSGDPEVDGNLTGIGFGLRFSATMN